MVLQYLLRIKYFQLNVCLSKLLLCGVYAEISLQKEHRASKTQGHRRASCKGDKRTRSTITHSAGPVKSLHTHTENSLKESYNFISNKSLQCLVFDVTVCIEDSRQNKCIGPFPLVPTRLVSNRYGWFCDINFLVFASLRLAPPGFCRWLPRTESFSPHRWTAATVLHGAIVILLSDVTPWPIRGACSLLTSHPPDSACLENHPSGN